MYMGGLIVIYPNHPKLYSVYLKGTVRLSSSGISEPMGVSMSIDDSQGVHVGM